MGTKKISAGEEREWAFADDHGIPPGVEHEVTLSTEGGGIYHAVLDDDTMMWTLRDGRVLHPEI